MRSLASFRYSYYFYVIVVDYSFPGGGGFRGRLKGVAGRISPKVNCDDLPPSGVTDYHPYTHDLLRDMCDDYYLFFFVHDIIPVESDTTVDQVKSIK